jgi:hypothetical protein
MACVVPCDVALLYLLYEVVSGERLSNCLHSMLLRNLAYHMRDGHALPCSCHHHEMMVAAICCTLLL